MLDDHIAYRGCSAVIATYINRKPRNSITTDYYKNAVDTTLIDRQILASSCRKGTCKNITDVTQPLIRYVGGVRMLVIDELHNLLSGSRSRQRQLLNLLRWLGNDLRIPLVGVGTGEALQAINSDDQLVSRFEPFMLPLWTEGDAYRRLLGTLEAVLPLRRPSNLTDPALSAKILTAAEGVLGEVIAIVNRAAVLAVKTGRESISARLIDDIRFIPLSERRRGSRHAL